MAWLVGTSCQDRGTIAGWWWLEHFAFVHILGILIPTDYNIFQRGWNHQPDSICSPLWSFHSLNGFRAGLWQVVHCKAQTFRQYLGRWPRILVPKPQGDEFFHKSEPDRKKGSTRKIDQLWPAHVSPKGLHLLVAVISTRHNRLVGPKISRHKLPKLVHMGKFQKRLGAATRLSYVYYIYYILNIY